MRWRLQRGMCRTGGVLDTVCPPCEICRDASDFADRTRSCGAVVDDVDERQ
jgi:hypothetical protein